MFEYVKNEMKNYYSKLPVRAYPKFYPSENVTDLDIREKIYYEMDCFYKEYPDTPSVLLKSRIHSLIAEYCRPKIFTGNPFFFEIGCKERDSWGIGDFTPAFWMTERLREKARSEHPICVEFEERLSKLFEFDKVGICNIMHSFDYDHHSLGYTNLFSKGVNGILKNVKLKKAEYAPGSSQYDFCLAAEESLNSLIKIAQKFSLKAKEMLFGCRDEKQRRYLEMIRDTAVKIPANPPQTFYEGLAMLLFTREVTAVLENIGISQLGHVDRLLYPLYKNDLKSGKITEAEARELIGLWMLHTDIKFDLENNPWPEISTCIQLGGCDINGHPIYNDVTRMFIEEHLNLGFINPKLNCRYSQNSPDEYIKAVGNAILKGHNNFVLINDDVVINGLVKNGVELCDARMYVNGGCQETMIEGFGHTEGAAIYVSVPKILDLFLYSDSRTDIIKPIQKADTFEDFYNQFLYSAKRFLSLMTDQRNIRQQFYKTYQVSPLFSATQTGCIENGKDYTLAGAKYNFSTIALVGFATLTDSLYAIKKLVYDRKLVTLDELISALKNNWKGYEKLRRSALSTEKYGCNNPEADAFANGLLAELSEYISLIRNERGGSYIPSLFVYYFYQYFSAALRATPDGRYSGDLLSMGCGPSQLTRITDITTTINSMSNIDFTVCCGGNAVLDAKFPFNKNFTPEIFNSFIRTCGKLGCPTLQPNVISIQELQDAKLNPEKHKNLIVRISGLSAYFVALTPEIQDEIIARNLYSI